jgi:hypothetical protein
MKSVVTHADLESQVALELPPRDMLALVVILFKTGDIDVIEVEDIDAALNVCNQVLTNDSVLKCTARA